MDHRATPLLGIATLAAALGLGLPGSSPATELTPPEQRISDERIHADHRTFESWQERIEAVAGSGRALTDYSLAKAQCWLDAAFHEYTRNDRSDFPERALGEAARLIEAMEQGSEPERKTPLIGLDRPLRPDLWRRLQDVDQTAGRTCATALIACAEVELVHAGNEYGQFKWRHAAPYVAIAEDLIGRAETAAADCRTPAP